MVRMIKESANIMDNFDRLIGLDFYFFLHNVIGKQFGNYGYEVIEIGDVDELSEGYVIISDGTRKYKVTYEWLWDDKSNEFRKGYKSGNILTIQEL